MEYSHLNKSTKQVLELYTQTKNKDILYDWLKLDHFVYHAGATQTINAILETYYQNIPPSEMSLAFFKKIGTISETESIEEEKTDFPSFAIIGDTGTGKSLVQKELIKVTKKRYQKEFEEYPIKRAILPDQKAGEKAMYMALLRPFLPDNVYNEFTNNMFIHQSNARIYTVDHLHRMLVAHLKTSKTKLMFLDEAHNLLDHHGKVNQSILNQLKKLFLDTQCTFVLVGTPKLEAILQQDGEIYDRNRADLTPRFENWYWTNGRHQEYLIEFLKAYEKFLPFSKPSNLSDPKIAFRFFEKVKFQDETILSNHNESCNLRNLVKFLQKVARRALRQDKELIDLDLIYETPYYVDIYGDDWYCIFCLEKKIYKTTDREKMLIHWQKAHKIDENSVRRSLREIYE